MISVVVPCYNEEVVLPAFVSECGQVASEMQQKFDVNFEFVFVDDGSSDATLQVVKSLAAKEDRFSTRWISFSRNFGKEAAIYAGLSVARGDFIVLMDADLQDPPSLLPQMYQLMQETSCDCVAARRTDRKGEGLVRSALSKLFYRVINALSEVDFVSGERDYRLMRRCVVDALLRLGEKNRFIKGIYGWLGFTTEWVTYENVTRGAGSTKWSLKKLFGYALNGITGFSTLPLQIASIGSMMLFLAFIAAIVFIIARYCLFGDPVAGWASTACIILFVGSLQLFCMGVLGQYLAKTYVESKGRPLYIIKDSSDE